MLPRGYLIGNFTADPVPGITNNSLDFSRFSVACNENYTRANQAAKTHYYQCIAWGKRAQYISTYLKKGDSVFIEFTLLTNNYTNIEGRVIKRVDLQVEKIEMLYQRLNKTFSSGIVSNETNVEEKELLRNQEILLDNTHPSSDKTETKEEEIDVDLSEIYNIAANSEKE
ncbi:single-stranded DNA-binding protein [Candidatus Mycoplasma haematominutum]|uniref:Single-stranded DNA-binding protein n=1 Tax=Candidatus Mycoplasma haematominutum 'Birmingham 1' TaxID=1116213 RepID=G8C2I6_9MOLU|nr:single-stranded DNA-binding protein [Candidatus Mycoplasma haematominutum]CCE66534.1 single-stranded DNA-binding protein [Candidatus Mycoplasma haematominutum 'Birmingham 1']